MRQQLQAILRTSLDEEGVTFTFDLPSAVLAEQKRREGSALEIAAYLETALACRDAWGTNVRALSARSAVLFRSGRVDEAFSALQEASSEAMTTTYAGYAVTAVLGLIDRCHEFGEPERARQPEWGHGGNETLVDMAAGFAQRVYDPYFRAERLELVARHEAWTREVPPDPRTVPGELSGLRDPDMRSAYLAHASARYAAPSTWSTASARLKPLVPYALFDATTSDLVLGRLMAVLAGELGEELEEIVQVTTDKLTTGRPWVLGSWR